jgi:DNA repair protein RecN (Recombination protein N)
MELGEARSAVAQALNDVEYDPQTLEQSEERLFELRAAARKYNTRVDDLPGVAAEMADKLAGIDHDEQQRADLKARVDACEAEYSQLARTLSEKRQNAAGMLDAQVMAELPPLKLEKAVFLTDVTTLEEGGPAGFDQVEFKIAANPGQTPAPMMKVASGGELARFILGLKVVLAECGSAPVLVFDEIDTGAGGAVADAIGRRLADLGGKLQVIAVTHSPQVAALAIHHWRISKRADLSGDEERALTEVHLLDPTAREEEVARMLSGASITEEARAAAVKLIGGQV